MMSRMVMKRAFWVARANASHDRFAYLGGPSLTHVLDTPDVLAALRAETPVELMRQLGAQYPRYAPVQVALTLSVHRKAGAWPTEFAAWGEGYSDEPVAPAIVDRSAVQLTDGSPVPADASHLTLRPNGQQQGYVVLSDGERAKGFVRPYRDAYRHVGVRPEFETRPLTPEEAEGHAGCKYVAYEAYPPGSRGSALGRFWTQAQLESGCGQVTTMARSLAETYACDPSFYGGTFCSTCGNHFRVGEHGEFTWLEMDGRDGPRVGT